MKISLSNIRAIFFLLLNIITSSSCKIDTCKETNCGAGVCTNGLCVCPNTYYGINCQLDKLENIKGNYNNLIYIDSIYTMGISNISFVNNDVTQGKITNIFGYNKPDGNDMIANANLYDYNPAGQPFYNNFVINMQPLYTGCDTTFDGFLMKDSPTKNSWYGNITKYYNGITIATYTLQLSK